MSQSIVIAAAARTPVGSFGGSLGGVAAHELGKTAITAALQRAGVDPKDVSEVVLGQVLTANSGMNPARQAARAAGVPDESPAWGLNQVCGSGLRAVVTGMQQIANGDASIVVAGGQESMSLSPHVAHLRNGQKMGGLEFSDSMIKDGLTDVFYGYHMGITAENVAEKWQITREEQDQFAFESQTKAAAAKRAGKFIDQIARVTVKGRKGDVTVDEDEYIRMDASLADMQKLKPAFKKDGGTVTAANASGINDGAAALVLMTEAEAMRRGITPLARIASWASRGVEPSVMGVGPIPSSRAALEKAGWKVSDLDLVEANEAFAAQALAVNKDMGWDPKIVNVNGGAIAIGHPIGASGARVLTTLLYELKAQKKSKGLATLCIGGGMGIALCVER